MSTKRSRWILNPGERVDAGGALETDAVSVHFEGVKAVKEVSLTVAPGEILGLIGPNGAGKTTLANVITGFQRPTSGAVRLDGRAIQGWSPEKIARSGVARTFQNVRSFARLSVLENVQLGARGVGASRREARRRADELLERMRLRESAWVTAASLSHGQDRRLGVARALAMRPRFLILDEPAAGMNNAETDELIGVLRDIPQEFDLGVLVIEHDMRLIMSLCGRIQVLTYGETLAIGSPDEIRQNADVARAYLGGTTEQEVLHALPAEVNP